MPLSTRKFAIDTGARDDVGKKNSETLENLCVEVEGRSLLASMPVGALCITVRRWPVLLSCF